MIVEPGSGVDPEVLISRFPYLYHMAECGSWPSIRKHGLLSTSALLDLFEIKEGERDAIESELRLTNIAVQHTKLGRAVIRDQCPMSISGLGRCLADGISPGQWLRTLNGRVFFWVSEKRLLRLLGASNYAAHEHDVLILDTRLLMRDYLQKIELCAMNSGATKPYPWPRGMHTFLPVEKYPWDHWVEKRGKRGETVVELTLAGGVLNVERYLVEARRMKGDKVLFIFEP